MLKKKQINITRIRNIKMGYLVIASNVIMSKLTHTVRIIQRSFKRFGENTLLKINTTYLKRHMMKCFLNKRVFVKSVNNPAPQVNV